MIPATAAFLIETSVGERPLEFRADQIALIAEGSQEAMTVTADPHGVAVFWSFGVGLVAQPDASRVVEDATRAVSQLQDPVVAQQAQSVISRFEVAASQFDLTGLPPLRTSLHDDGSFTIEWRFPDRRLAFTIEHDPSESGWHLVSLPSSGDVRAYGGLSEDDLAPLLSLALRRLPS